MIEVTKEVAATLAVLVQSAPSSHGDVVGAAYTAWDDPAGEVAVWALYDAEKPVTALAPHEPVTACLVGMYDPATGAHRALAVSATGDVVRLARSEFEPVVRLARSEFEPVVRFRDWVEHRTGEVTATFPLPLD